MHADSAKRMWKSLRVIWWNYGMLCAFGAIYWPEIPVSEMEQATDRNQMR